MKAGLATSQTSVDDLSVSCGNLGLLTETTLTLGGLLGQDVALVGLGAHKLAGTGAAETLLGAAVGLHLRHELLLCRLQTLFLGCCLVALVIEGTLNRSEEHEHVTAFELRSRLDRSKRFKVLSQTLEHVETLLGMSHLAATEHDGDLNACALLEESQDVTLLGLVVTHVNLGTEFHFLNFDPGLVLTSLLGLHGLLVLELAIIHDPAYRRFCVRRDFHQVKALLIGNALRIADAEQTKLRTINADQTARARGDLPVNTGVIRLSYCSNLLLCTKQKPGAKRHPGFTYRDT